MTTSTTAPDRRSPLTLVGRALAGLVVIASFGIWAYRFSGQADRPPPDLLADTDLAARAEAICAAAVADVDAMPSAADAVDGPDRAEQVIRATDRFAVMVTELEALEVTGAEDQVIMNGWLGDWRVLLGDRRGYAEAVAIDPAAPFLMTDVAANERLDRRITRMATTNAMPSCAMPTDAG
jgi:hypothetical protein